MSSKIPLLDLVAQYQTIKTEIDVAVQRVLDSGRYILGEEVSSFEEEMAAYLGVKHAIGVASGTDALILALRALDIGEGDEVILPAYTFFATASTVMHVGARPVLVDIDPRTYCMDVDQFRNAVTDKTRAVIPVHLYGHPADMGQIGQIAEEYGLSVIEDNAQAIGAKYRGKKTGSLGDVACLSFFPSKNLGAYGDAGMVVTDSGDIADQVRQLRVHGWKVKYFPEMLGYNSRLDALQAAILRVKLRYLDQWNQRRREIAALYDQVLEGISSRRKCGSSSISA
jgi:dTDP-4-amino-4,6-dideoxygalactose transaminase